MIELKKSIKRHGLIAPFIAIALLATGCSADGDTDTAEETTATEAVAEATEETEVEPTEEETVVETEETKDAGADDVAADTFPLVFENADGTTTEIPNKPEKILSTSVTITGMLVPIDAPVIASGVAANGEFFPAWAEEAKEAGIETLWSANTPAVIESVAAQEPDLILVSVTGADSVVDSVPQLQEIAPTVIINYSQESWQEVTKKLGMVTGHSEDANNLIEKFGNHVEEVKNSITHPEGTTSVVSYNGADKPNPIAKEEGPYGQIFSDLGFDFEGPKEEWSDDQTNRNDFEMVAYEKLVDLTADNVFLISAGQEKADAFLADPVLANIPSVQKKQVYALGESIFRLDYYSSTELLERVKELFG